MTLLLGREHGSIETYNRIITVNDTCSAWRVNLITAQEGLAHQGYARALFFCFVGFCSDPRYGKRGIVTTDPNASGNAPSCRPGAVLFVAAFAAFLATFNETFLNVGFTPIMESFHVDVSTVQWLATAYMLGAAVMVPVSAFAYRSIPTRLLFCTTVGVLVAGSIIGAVAPTFPVLLVGRIVQSLGTGMLIPIGMNITLEIAPREKLGSYMGIMGAMTTLGPSSSVILAGGILAVASWPMLFWVFAGLSAACLCAGAVILRDIAHLTHPRLDALSVALVGIALIGILYSISTVFSGSLLTAGLAAVVGLVSLVLFLRRQHALAEPLIDLRPLTISPFAMGVVANMLSLLTIFAMNIIVPMYLQSALGTPPLIASLTLFPAILCSCGLSPLAGRIYDEHGTRFLLPVGFACIAIFSALTGMVISTASPWVLALVYIPVIGGSALIIGPVQSFALSKLSYEMNPHGVTIMSTGFQIAGCIGSSVFTGIYAGVSAATSATGAGFPVAASEAMLTVGILVGAVGVIGFFLSLVIVRKDGTGYGRSSRATDARSGKRLDGAAAEPSVAEVMKEDVYALPQTALVADALRLFIEKGISGAPILSTEGRVVGFISDGDVMRSLADQVPAFKSAWSFVVERENADFDRTVRETMNAPVFQLATSEVITVSVSDDLGAVARVLAERHLKKAPVMEGERMVGIVNRSNITRYAVSIYLD